MKGDDQHEAFDTLEEFDDEGNQPEDANLEGEDFDVIMPDGDEGKPAKPVKDKDKPAPAASADVEEEEENAEGIVSAEEDEVFQAIYKKAKARGGILPVHNGKQWDVEEASEYAVSSANQLKQLNAIDNTLLSRIGIDPQDFNNQVQEYLTVSQLDPVEGYIRMLAVDEINRMIEREDFAEDDDLEAAFKETIKKYRTSTHNKLTAKPSFMDKINAQLSALEDPRLNIIDAVNKVKQEDLQEQMTTQRKKIDEDAEQVVLYAKNGKAILQGKTITNSLSRQLVDKSNEAEVERLVRENYELVVDTVDGEAVSTIRFFKKLTEDPAYIAKCIYLLSLYESNAFKNLNLKSQQEAIKKLNNQASLIKRRTGSSDSGTMEILKPS